MSKIIAIVNQKGGVGKTTTAVNLSAAIADMGYKTLLIDIDPQANTCLGIGISRDKTNKGIFPRKYPVQIFSIFRHEKAHIIPER